MHVVVTEPGLLYRELHWGAGSLQDLDDRPVGSSLLSVRHEARNLDADAWEQEIYGTERRFIL